MRTAEQIVVELWRRVQAGEYKTELVLHPCEVSSLLMSKYYYRFSGPSLDITAPDTFMGFPVRVECV